MAARETTKEYVRHFKDIDKSHLPLVGGKGANLGEMYAKFAIPEGFCVTVHAFEEFLGSAKLRPVIKEKLSRLDVEKTDDLNKVSEELQTILKKTPIPKHIIAEIKKHHERVVGLVAVRSSATAEDLPNASFAGQQATLLNVKGPDGVVEAVRECWASLYTSRAIYYRNKNKFKHEDVSIAVVVQKMVDSRVAGVAFTANPVNNDRGQMVVEAVFGLGETIVSGSVTPDTFILQKKPLKLLETHVGYQRFALYQRPNGGNKTVEFDENKGSKRKLADAQVLDLAKEFLKIELHYGLPQDIEWALDKDGKLHILQSRPITTLR